MHDLDWFGAAWKHALISIHHPYIIHTSSIHQYIIHVQYIIYRIYSYAKLWVLSMSFRCHLLAAPVGPSPASWLLWRPPEAWNIFESTK